MKIARTKPPMSYTQKTTAPYLLSKMPDGLSMPDIPDLVTAVDEFVRYGLPPDELFGGCIITDYNGVLTIGYAFNQFNEEPLRWAGVESAVHELRLHHLVEPLLMASIEMALETT